MSNPVSFSSWIYSAKERLPEIVNPMTQLFHAAVPPIQPSETPLETPLMLWKWTQRIGLGILGTITAIALTGALYQAIGAHLDEKRYPAPGKMVDIGGYRLHIHSTGEGGPTVVLNAGMGLNSLDWALVQPEIAKFTSVCSFDCPGNGWSDESPLERTAENNVEELRTLLKNAGILAPYILVGHSGAGIDSRLFASKYPEEVAGVILVDSSHEEQLKLVPPPPKFNSTAFMLCTHFGLTRLWMQSAAYKQAVAMFPKEIQEATLAKMQTAKFMRTILHESAAFETSLAQLKENGGFLNDLPLTVITAGKTMASEGTGYTKEQLEQIMPGFRELQRDLATKSTCGKQIIAEESDHLIPRHQPAIIVDAVREQVERLRLPIENPA